MTMPSITGLFTAKITKQNGMPLVDHPKHELSLAEVTGTQESPDPLWNGSQVTYWAVTDVQDGKGTQTGYYNNVHGRPRLGDVRGQGNGQWREDDR
jgi:hypothetical protein